MIASAHIVAGAVAGLSAALLIRARTPALLTAFALGLLSHQILDAIPHSDYAGLSIMAIRLVGAIEIVLCLAIIVYATRPRLSRTEFRSVLAGIAGGAVLDVKFFQPFLPDRFRDPIKRIAEKLHPFHAAEPESHLLGLAFELVTLALATGGLAWLASRTKTSKDQPD